MSGTGLPDLVAHAYEAACDAEGMDDFIRDAAEYFGASQAALTVWPIRRPSAMLTVTHGISADAVRMHFENRCGPDSLFGKLATLPAGETFVARELFAKPGSGKDNGLGSRYLHMLAGVLLADDSNRCALLFARQDGEDTFSQIEHETLQTLMGYFRRAVKLSKRFITMSIEHKWTLAVINNAPRGIVTIGQRGQVIHANSLARRILDNADGLSLVGNTIIFHDLDVRKKIEDFFDEARQSGEDATRKKLSTVVKRRSMGPSFQLTAEALPFEKMKAALNEDEALAVFIIYDPQIAIDLKIDGLKIFYKLSGAEARLAETLLKGDALPKAADSLGISVNTARSQLRGIFKKLGVKTQAGMLQEFAKALK